MVIIIISVAKNQDGRGVSSTNSSPSPPPTPHRPHTSFLMLQPRGSCENVCQIMSLLCSKSPRELSPGVKAKDFTGGHKPSMVCPVPSSLSSSVAEPPLPTSVGILWLQNAQAHPCPGHLALPSPLPGIYFPQTSVCFICSSFFLSLLKCHPADEASLVTLFLLFISVFHFDIYLFMCLCMAALGLHCNLRSLSLQVRRLFFGESRLPERICIWD